MFDKLKKLFGDHSGKVNVASYTALIIAGFTGYTNLVKAQGALESKVEYQQQEIARQAKVIDKTTLTYAKLSKDYRELVMRCSRHGE